MPFGYPISFSRVMTSIVSHSVTVTSLLKMSSDSRDRRARKDLRKKFLSTLNSN